MNDIEIIEKNFKRTNSMSVAKRKKDSTSSFLPKERSSLDAWIQVTSKGIISTRFQLFVHSLSLSLSFFLSSPFFSFLSVCLERDGRKTLFSNRSLPFQDDRCSVPYSLESKISTEACPGKGISACSWKRWRGFSNLRATDFVARLRVQDSWSVADRNVSIGRAEWNRSLYLCHVVKNPRIELLPLEIVGKGMDTICLFNPTCLFFLFNLIFLR